MGLPLLNDVPKYQIEIPSTGKEVLYRPFLVKEEKILLLALESGDIKQITQAIYDTVMSCVLDKINGAELTSYDVEYLFMNIRARSVGETSKVNIKCTNCELDNEIVINIPDITIDVNESKKIIEINKTVSVEMKHPSYVSMSKNKNIADDKISNKIFGLIQESIAAILTPEERIDVKDVSTEEFQDFIDSMTGAQFNNIREFVESIPRLAKQLEFDCTHCRQHNEITLEGMQNFL